MLTQSQNRNHFLGQQNHRWKSWNTFRFSPNSWYCIKNQSVRKELVQWAILQRTQSWLQRKERLRIYSRCQSRPHKIDKYWNMCSVSCRQKRTVLLKVRWTLRRRQIQCCASQLIKLSNKGVKGRPLSIRRSTLERKTSDSTWIQGSCLQIGHLLPNTESSKRSLTFSSSLSLSSERCTLTIKWTKTHRNSEKCSGKNFRQEQPL
jgi:hypothetical protein